jgi:hypothetical protein
MAAWRAPSPARTDGDWARAAPASSPAPAADTDGEPDGRAGDETAAALTVSASDEVASRESVRNNAAADARRRSRTEGAVVGFAEPAPTVAAGVTLARVETAATGVTSNVVDDAAIAWRGRSDRHIAADARGTPTLRRMVARPMRGAAAGCKAPS